MTESLSLVGMAGSLPDAPLCEPGPCSQFEVLHLLVVLSTQLTVDISENQVVFHTQNRATLA